MLDAIYKVTASVKENEDKFVELANAKLMGTAVCWTDNDKEKLSQSEKRITDLDKLFTRLYEDNVSGKITDEHFKTMTESYKSE